MPTAGSLARSLAGAALLVAIASAAASAAKPVTPAPAVEGYRVVETALPKGEIARAGAHTVTAAEVRARVAALRSGARAGHDDPARLREQALLQILDEKYLGERLRATGLDKDRRVERLRWILTRLIAARQYADGTIRPKILVTEQEVQAKLPRSREEARLRILLLRQPEDEAKIRAEAARGVLFEDLVERFSVTGGGFGLKGDLGFLGKNGLYFDPAEEDYLWDLAPDVISRPIETRIGPALVLMIEKRRIADDAWKELETKMRNGIASSRLQVYIRALVKRHPPQIDEAAFRRAGEAMDAEDRFTDFMIGTVGGEEIFFHDLDRLHTVSYQDIVRKANAKQIAEYYRGFLVNVFAPEYALGIEAERAGVVLDDKSKTGIEELVGNALVQVALQDAFRGVAVTEKEIRQEYDAGTSRLMSLDRVRLAVLVTEKFEEALQAAEAYRAGTPFAVLVAQHSVDKNTKKRNGDLGWLPADKVPLALRDELDGVKKGELLPIHQEKDGYHLTLLVEQGNPKPSPLADVRDRIARHLLAQKREAAARDRFKALRSGVELKVDRAQLEGVAMKGGAALGLSPHGGH